jgi:hypothetical protein
MLQTKENRNHYCVVPILEILEMLFKLFSFVRGWLLDNLFGLKCVIFSDCCVKNLSFVDDVYQILVL